VFTPTLKISAKFGGAHIFGRYPRAISEHFCGAKIEKSVIFRISRGQTPHGFRDKTKLCYASKFNKKFWANFE
jgi:hypothetical protein